MTRSLMSGSRGPISRRAMLSAPGIHSGAGVQTVFKSACVVGAGRVGTALAARLRQHVPTRTTTHDLEVGDSELVVICVPDRSIAEVAQAIPAGPWIAHTSGARGLTELAPHERRFSLHPLQTFTLSRGPEQFDGAWAAISVETPEALDAAHGLAGLLGLRAFELEDARRPLYHAAAIMASPFLVTLHDVAASLLEVAGGPPDALTPLMLRTIENGFQHTGPQVRNDQETLERAGAAVRELHDGRFPLFEYLAQTEGNLLRERAG
jgi:predicted short-subunit dehydrogenase-like oxidoreductase (DUF2520 family)